MLSCKVTLPLMITVAFPPEVSENESVLPFPMYTSPSMVIVFPVKMISAFFVQVMLIAGVKLFSALAYTFPCIVTFLTFDPEKFIPFIAMKL